MTDTERIRRDLVACRDIPWSCSCVEPEQLAALVKEVERLRAEADEMRRWAEEAAHAENLNAQDAQKERAAVVAYLRDCSNRCREWDGRELAVSATYRLAAAVIERGEHRREREPIEDDSIEYRDIGKED